MNRRKFLLMFCLLVILPIGVVLAVWSRQREEPFYTPVDTNALGGFNLDQQNGTINDIPQQFRNLEGHRIRLAGEMWAPRPVDGNGLANFQLIANKVPRTYGGPPLAQYFINAQVPKGISVQYSDERVTVDGIFHVRLVKVDGMLKSVFAIDVECVALEASPPPQPQADHSLMNESEALAYWGAGMFVTWICLSRFSAKRARRNILIDLSPVPQQP